MLLFSGCMNSEKPNSDADSKSVKGNIFEKEQKTSTFFLDPKKPTNINPLGAEDNLFKLPNRKSYDFRVCVLDQGTRRELPNFPFDITDHKGTPISKETVELKTDQYGCLNWTEEIKYSPTKDAVEPILFIRQIHGRGNVKGMRRFVFELFPWDERDTFDEFRDLTLRTDLLDRKADCIEAIESGEAESCSPVATMTLNENDGLARLSLGSVGYELYNSGNFNIIPRGQERDANGNFVGNPFNTDFVTKLSEDQIDSNLLDSINRTEYVTKDEGFAGMRMNLRLRMSIRREFKKEGNRTGFEPLNDGSFAVQAFILSKNLVGGRPVLLTPNMPVTVQSIQDGLLNIEVNTILPYVPNAGRVVLALRLVPLANNLFKPIEELYEIGNFDSLISRTSPWRDAKSFDAENEFSFQNYIESAVDGVDISDSGVLRENKPYQFSMFNIKFRTVEAGETAAKRTVIYTSEICITDERARRVGEGAEFEVYSLRYPIDYVDDGDDTNDKEGEDYEVVPLFADRDGDRIKADAKGCIRFIDKMRHKYYKTERLVKRKVLIKRKNDENDPGTTLTVYINPWDEKFGTFGTDARAVSKTFLEDLQNRKKIPSRFFIKDFGYETLRFRYEIDENMKLQVKKTVLFRTRPLVLRYSNILQGINSIHDLRDGIYLFKLAYQKDYLDPAASTRDTVSKMRQRADFAGVPTEELDPNSLEVNSLSSPTRNTGKVDENGFPVYEYDESKAQLEVIRPNHSSSATASADLTVKGRVVNDDIRARTQRLNSRSGAQNSHMIDAKFDPRKKQNLSIVKKLVRVNAGNIITPIEFSVDDLRLLRIRSQLFVQVEPVNQIRLQLVNMASKIIERSLIMKKGQGSEYTCLPEDIQKEIQAEKMEALDILAKSIDDDVYINSVDDLKKIFSKPEVVEAFAKFSNVGEFQNLNYIFQTITHKGNDIFEQKSIIDLGIDSDDVDLVEVRRRQSIVEKIERDNNYIEQAKQYSVDIENQINRSHDLNVRLKNDEMTLTYVNSNEFENFCRDSYSNYSDCVVAAQNAGNSIEESAKICKCYDAVSQEFQPIELEEARSILDNRKSQAVAEFLSSLTGEEALADLLTNDFTLNAASSDVSDLDLLLDEYKDDDIKPRTFVGPLTFVKNANGGSLRPTDNLDEGHCVTDDCNTVDPIDRYGSIKNFAYERSKYHGSIAHFAGVQVDDFIKGAIKIGGRSLLNESGQEVRSADFSKYINDRGEVVLNGEVISEAVVIPSYQEYKTYKKNKENFESMLYHFVSNMNLNYISLQDKPLEEPLITDECLSNLYDLSSDCKKTNTDRTLKKNQLMDDYLDTIVKSGAFSSVERAKQRLSFNASNKFRKCRSVDGMECFEPPTEEVLRGVVKKAYPESNDLNYTGVVPVGYARFSQQEYTNMCAYLVYGSIGKHLYQKAEETTHEGLWASISQKDFRERKSISGKLRDLTLACIENMGDALSIERKYKINQTGRYYYLGGKSLNINLGQSTGISHSSSVGRNFGFSPSDIIQGVPKAMGAPKKGFLGFAGEILNSFSWSYSRGNGYSASAGTSINQGTFLVMQNAEFDVELTAYEQCITARWSEPMIQRFSDIFTGKVMSKDGEPDEELGEKIRSGLMICSGETETDPIAVRETYYYFTQHFVEGDMQDRNDIHNHPWLLQLRGLREYETFLAATQSDHIQADEEGVETVHAFELINTFDMMKSDLDSARSIISRSMSDEGYGKFDRLKRHSWPLTQLIRTYRRVSPTFPGLYTQLDNAAYVSEQWPWDSEPGKALNEAEVEEQSRCEGIAETE